MLFKEALKELTAEALRIKVGIGSTSLELGTRKNSDHWTCCEGIVSRVSPEERSRREGV